jgi:Arm DNA-binding domain
MPVTLTDRVVQQAKAKNARVEIADAVLPGLYLVVQPTGAKSWAVRYRMGPRTRKLTLPGRYPVLSLAKARETARLALESLTAGADPAAAKHAGTPADDTLAATSRFIARNTSADCALARPPTPIASSSTCRMPGRVARCGRSRRKT